MTPSPRSQRAAALVAAALLLVAALVSGPAFAQTPSEQPAAAMRAGEGRIAGRVSDAKTGAQLEGVTVILNFPSPPEGGEVKQEFRVTDSAGEFVFGAVPAGRYRVEFLKAGYGAGALADFAVDSGRESRAELQIEERGAAAGSEAGSGAP